LVKKGGKRHQPAGELIRPVKLLSRKGQVGPIKEKLDEEKGSTKIKKKGETLEPLGKAKTRDWGTV